MHILNFGVKHTSKTKEFKLPFELSANLGFLYSYYTMIDSEDYTRSDYGNNGNCRNVSFSTSYEKVDTEEYPVQWGFVIGFGAKVSF